MDQQFCTNCGKPVEPNHSFCTNCGTAYQQPVQQPAQQPVQQPQSQAQPAAPQPARSIHELPLSAAGAVSGGMPSRLATTSIYTLTLLFGFLAAIVLLSLYAANLVSGPLVLIATIVLNIIIWAVGPWFSDLMYSWFYNTKFYTPQELAAAKPDFANFLQELSRRQGIPMPKVGIIDDDNPTAFTYGSNTRNARIVVTKGLWTYLDEDEIAAVVAHEVGHIVHRDFIVMAIANTILQLLYEIYYMTNKSGRNSSSNSDSNKTALIGLIALIFYEVGFYVVLFLSRLRETYADEFSAKATGKPNLLSTALVKIAYGIVAKDEDKESSSARLLQSTRTLGIMGPQAAQQAGTVAKAVNMDSTGISKACLFDLVSPWAKLAEIASTHPLTGKRLARLERMAVSMGQTPVYPISRIAATTDIDNKRLWNGFWGGVAVNYGPVVLFALSFLALIGAVLGVSALALIACILLLSAALSMFARARYRYPSFAATPSPAPATTVLEQMQNVYASPVKGIPVQLQGNIIGRGNAGFVAGEDVMMRDNTGLMYLNYTSPWGFIGNFFFGLRKVKHLIGQPAVAEGWFFRSFTQQVVLRRMQPQAGQLGLVKSYARFWSFAGAWIMLLLSLALLAIVAMAATNS